MRNKTARYIIFVMNVEAKVFGLSQTMPHQLVLKVVLNHYFLVLYLFASPKYTIARYTIRNREGRTKRFSAAD